VTPSSSNAASEDGRGLDDLSLLPRRFSLFVEEMRTVFDLLNVKVTSAFDRIDSGIEDLSHRVSALEKIDSGIEKLSQRVSALEKAQHRFADRIERELRSPRARKRKSSR
jgi:predicted transcriptional regulator